MAGIAMDYINYARQFASSGSYSRSLDLYVTAFEKDPQIKQLFEPEFRAVVLKCNEVLAEDNRIESIIANFSKAMKLFPDNIFFLNESGRHLFMYGFYDEAWRLFQQVLSTDAGAVQAEKSLNSVKNVMIERWHFRMLNDKIRNDSYRAAINKKVHRKSRVLDLGTGTGLLAMYANEGKPFTITACDSSSLMTTLTECILAENRLLMSVLIINKISTAMNEADIGRKCSLLITELFDAGLFGEHILKSMEHAWEKLLDDNADIIPQKAEFFIMGAHSELLNAKYQMRPITKSFLKLHHSLNVHISTKDETYDCEDVHLFKDMKYMTEPQSVIKIDFTDLSDIKDKLYGNKPYVVECKALENGEINTFIGWFKLYLTEDICITTDPRAKDRANAWQQAVFYDKVPRGVQENEIFNLEFSLKSEKMTMKPDSSEIIRLSSTALRFLNDTEYMNMIKNCVGMTCIHLGQMTTMCQVNIVDLNPFPLYGFLMLQRGINSLTCYAKNQEDKEFIETVFAANGMDTCNVTILLREKCKIDSFKDQKFNVIFVNVFDLYGDLNMEFHDLAKQLRNGHLMPGGLFMPSSITIMGQIVNCDWLDITNRVYDRNVGYKVAKYVNRYQVSQNFNIDYAHLEYTPLTDPVIVGYWNKLTPEVLNMPIIRSGEANTIICWYHIELIARCEEITTKRAHSFIDGTVYLANPPINMIAGNTANILRCVEKDDSYKLIIDKENT